VIGAVRTDLVLSARSTRSRAHPPRYRHLKAPPLTVALSCSSALLPSDLDLFRAEASPPPGGRVEADDGRLSFQMLVTGIAPASRIALTLAPSSSPSGV
jgi:hypothetical protein